MRTFIAPGRLALLVLLASCGSERATQTTGSVVVSGTIKGRQVSFTSGAGMAAYQSAGAANTQTLIMLSSESDVCAAATAAQRHANSVRLSAAAYAQDANGGRSVAQVGTYTVEQQNGPHAGAFVGSLLAGVGDNCARDEDLIATPTMGSMTFTEVSEQWIAGSFNLAFDNDLLIGNFKVPNCAALGKIYSGEQLSDTCLR